MASFPIAGPYILQDGGPASPPHTGAAYISGPAAGSAENFLLSSCMKDLRLTVNVLPMSDTIDRYNLLFFIYRINYPEISHT